MTISGAGIRRMRLLRSMKQEHLAELLGVNQATISRWERDKLALSPEQAIKLERIFASPPHAAVDAALKRLVEDSVRPAHLICDRTHRLSALNVRISASPRWPALPVTSIVITSSPDRSAADAIKTKVFRQRRNYAWACRKA